MNKMKFAIVTGASRGIGKATAIKLSKLGFQVVGVYKSSSKLAKQLEKNHSGILMVKSDAGKEKQVLKAINVVRRNFGRLDVLVNNAGIDIDGKIAGYSARDFDRMVATNLKAAVFFSKHSIPLLKKSQNPVIVNVSSRLGFHEFTEPEYVIYGCLKAALSNFTIGLSKELKPERIRVNAIIPTPTKTDLFDHGFTPEDEKELARKGKLGTPDEAAGLIIKLILDKKANGKILIDKRVNL